MVPIDVFQPKISDITGAQGESGEKQHNGTIPCSHGCRRVTGRDDAFDIFLRQMTRQCGELLPRNRRHSSRQSRTAKTLQCKEAQIVPKR